MKATAIFNSIVISLTTSLVFLMWILINKLTSTYPELFDNDNIYHVILGITIAALTSVGIYRSVYLLTYFLIKNVSWVKKIVFGPSYIEGTWIGFYIGVTGNVRYFIETYEQDFDHLILRGKSFNERENFHSTWYSDSLSLDDKNGKLSYHYKIESPVNLVDHVGIAIFNFERNGSRSGPKMLIGFSTDIHFPHKCSAMEYKYSDKFCLNLNDGINAAKEFYAIYSNHFFLQEQ